MSDFGKINWGVEDVIFLWTGQGISDHYSQYRLSPDISKHRRAHLQISAFQPAASPDWQSIPWVRGHGDEGDTVRCWHEGSHWECWTIDRPYLATAFMGSCGRVCFVMSRVARQERSYSLYQPRLFLDTRLQFLEMSNWSTSKKVS